MRTPSSPYLRGRRPHRMGAVLGVAVVALVALAACSGSGSPAASSTTTAEPTSDSTTTTAVATTSSTTATTSTTITFRPPTSSTTVITTPPIVQTLNCTTNDLSVSVGGGQSGLNHLGYVILFENTGPHCFMHGYPILDGEDAAGAILAVANQTPSGALGGLGTNVAEPTFVLETGQTASAFYEGLAPTSPGASCPRYTTLSITPPNETHAVRVLSPQPICQLEIHPVVPGSSGNDP